MESDKESKIIRGITLLLIILVLCPSILTILYYGLHVHWSDYWPTFNYLIGYEYGFGGRKLLGTIFGPLLPQWITAKSIRKIVVPTNTLMVLLMGFIIWLLFKKDGAKKFPLAIILIIYLISPFSILNYVQTRLSLFFMETYQLVLIEIWIILFICCREKWYYYLTTFIVSAACCLIHHTFCCTLYPLMLGLFVYDILKQDKINIYKSIIYSANVLLMLVLFFIIWRYSQMNVELDELYAILSSRANKDVLPDKHGLDLLYFYNNTANYNHSMNTYFYIKFFVELLMLLPAIVLFVLPWIKASQLQPVLLNRLRYLLPILCVILFTIPIFFVATDYSRWWVCFFFNLAIILLIVGNFDNNFYESLNSLATYGFKHYIIILLLVVYLLQLHNSHHLFTGMQESEELLSFFGIYF